MLDCSQANIGKIKKTAERRFLMVITLPQRYQPKKLSIIK